MTDMQSAVALSRAEAEIPTPKTLSKSAAAIRTAFAEYGVEPAAAEEVAPAHALAMRLIGGPMASVPTIARVHRETGAGLFVVRGQPGEIRGLLAFILLSRAGATAAVRDDFNALAPRLAYVARGAEEPAAIYSWAIVAVDKDAAQRLIQGHERLRHAAVAHLPFYCRLATEQGRRLGIVRMGFKPLPGSTTGIFWSEPKEQSLVEAAA
ncbi:MAG TPA: hypothetical protein VKT30_10335 [Caulobacteraceae bacterium]|nr:hypothetical protein [Caulobacteraceae bacterium]